MAQNVQKERECTICGNTAIELPSKGASTNYDCPRCGKFKITSTADSMFESEEGVLGAYGCRGRANLSSWVRERKPQEMIDSSFFDKENTSNLGLEYKIYHVPTIDEKADKLLLAFAAKSEYAGHSFFWLEDRFEYEARAWALHQGELAFVTNILVANNMINGGVFEKEELEYDSAPYNLEPFVQITPKGWQRIQEINETRGSGDQVFIACSFRDEIIDVMKSYVLTAISDAGYKYEFLVISEHNDKLDDKIIAEIRKSKFIVADLTDHKPNVYYETGFAKGMGTQVILTCQETGDKEKDRIHFDISTYPCIYWKDEDKSSLQERLKNRIEAVFGRGPRPSP